MVSKEAGRGRVCKGDSTKSRVLVGELYTSKQKPGINQPALCPNSKHFGSAFLLLCFRFLGFSSSSV